MKKLQRLFVGAMREQLDIEQEQKRSSVINHDGGTIQQLKKTGKPKKPINNYAHFIKGLLIVFGMAMLWGLGISLLAYITSYLPAIITGGIGLGIILIMYVNFSELYGQDRH